MIPESEGQGPRGAGLGWARRSKRLRTGMLAGAATALPSLLGAEATVWQASGTALASVALGLAALAEGRGKTGRAFIIAASTAIVVAQYEVLLKRPGLALVLGLAVVLLVARSRRPLPTGGLDLAEPASLPSWGVLIPTLAVTLSIGVEPNPLFIDEFAATVTGVLGAGLALLSFYGIRTSRSRLRRAGLATWLCAISAAAIALDDHAPRLAALAFATSLPALTDLLEARRGRPFSAWASPIASRPALMLVVTFGVTATFGAILLWLPISATHSLVTPVDAFFTAISATCVTGLIVLDTPTAFSGFGQFVLFALIQVGGLGIMTFSTAALAIMRRRPSLRHERALGDLFVARPNQDALGAVKDLLRVTALVELSGGLILTLLFWLRHGDTLGGAAWRGLFTSVSAYCNAGFALQTDSLMPYAQDPLVIQTISCIIIAGGLGPVATLALGDVVRRRPISITVRIILVTSLALTLSGAVVLGAFEWHASLENLGVLDKLHNAFFQSVTLRTAGFNSVDFATLRPETQLLMMGFMFIGGSPGSTAGGIKTTTFAVVLLSVVSLLRGRPETLVKLRRIDHETFYRAVGITVLGISSAMGLTVLLLLTQPIAPLSALFEAFSATATVGLSVGATGQLDDVGKLLVAAGMFAGRLGPLTLLLLFAARQRPPPFRHPHVGVPVG